MGSGTHIPQSDVARSFLVAVFITLGPLSEEIDL